MEAFAAALREAGIATQTGRFGARMRVELVNEGPVTIVVDSAETWSGRGGADSAANFVDNRRLGARFCAFGFTFAPGLRCLDQESCCNACHMKCIQTSETAMRLQPIAC